MGWNKITLAGKQLTLYLARIKFDALVKSQNRSNRNYFHNFKFAVEYAKKSF